MHGENKVGRCECTESTVGFYAVPTQVWYKMQSVCTFCSYSCLADQDIMYMPFLA